MGLNRKLPHAVTFAPLKYGGMMFPETYCMQDQVQVSYLLKQLQWNKTVANNIIF